MAFVTSFPLYLNTSYLLNKKNYWNDQQYEKKNYNILFTLSDILTDFYRQM